MGKRELLFSLTKKDFDIQRFKSGGKGGQHQNTCDSGVRIIHKASGAVGESREHRSQHQNKKSAFDRLLKTSEFKLWHSKMVFELSKGKTIEEIVDEKMQPKNLKIEGKDEKGRWVKLTEES